VARDELPAGVASITAVLQILLAADYDPANEIRNTSEPDQHAEPTYEANIETQRETPLDQGHGEATPDMYNGDYGLNSSLLGSIKPTKGLYNRVFEPKRCLNPKLKQNSHTVYEEDNSVTLVGRSAVSERADTAPPVRRMTSQRSEVEMERSLVPKS
jgi:hypothetical protein